MEADSLSSNGDREYLVEEPGVCLRVAESRQATTLHSQALPTTNSTPHLRLNDCRPMVLQNGNVG